MQQEYTIGFSPCPNDTFIFDALVNKKIDTGLFDFKYVLDDVETLNNWAFKEKLSVTKLSFNTFLKLVDKYALLDSGSALGKGVGPLLISKKPCPSSADMEQIINNSSIAIPGKNTTANLLLTMAFPEAKMKTELVFNEIESKVLAAEYDLGLIIHENRFTYYERGLHKWMDMGDWWEQKSGAAIPLGGICISRNIKTETAVEIGKLIKKSIDYAWLNYPELSVFTKENAQEMEEEIMRKHIELYVNQYSSSLGVVGRKAVDTLFEMAFQNKIIPSIPKNIYL